MASEDYVENLKVILKIGQWNSEVYNFAFETESYKIEKQGKAYEHHNVNPSLSNGFFLNFILKSKLKFMIEIYTLFFSTLYKL